MNQFGHSKEYTILKEIERSDFNIFSLLNKGNNKYRQNKAQKK